MRVISDVGSKLVYPIQNIIKYLNPYLTMPKNEIIPLVNKSEVSRIVTNAFFLVSGK